MGDDLVGLFMKIGLTEQKAKETSKNKNLSKNLASVVTEASGTSADLAACGTLLYTMASKTKPQVMLRESACAARARERERDHRIHAF